MTKTRATQDVSRKITTVEAELVEAVAPQPDKPPMKLISTIGGLGDQPPLRWISASMAVVGLLSANGRLIRAGARMLLAHEVATTLKNVIKGRVNRTRPRSANSHDERKVKPGTSTAKEETSFPSGHSAGAMAVARAFSREFPEHQAAAVAAAGLVAAAQVPRCAHYPSDVGAGLLLGLASEAVTNLAFNEAEKHALDTKSEDLVAT